MPYKRDAHRKKPTEKFEALKILCAEDEKNLALILKLWLEREGHFVECFEDGLAAWERVRDEPTFFDLLITDHNMPRMDGVRFVEAVRTLSFKGKIVVHSSHLPDPIAEQYQALKVDYVFRKPIETKDLIGIVKQMNAEKKDRRSDDS